MFDDEWGVFQTVIASRARTRWSAAWALSAGMQMLRIYWWWVPLLLLSMLAGSAVASHYKAKPLTEANPTLLVKKKTNLLVRQA